MHKSKLIFVMQTEEKGFRKYLVLVIAGKKLG